MRRVHSRLLLSLDETALLLGIGRSTLYRAVKDGQIPFPVHRIGGYWYVPKAALQRFLDGTESSEEADSDRWDGAMPENGRREVLRCAQPHGDPLR